MKKIFLIIGILTTSMAYAADSWDVHIKNATNFPIKVFFDGVRGCFYLPSDPTVEIGPGVDKLLSPIRLYNCPKDKDISGYINITGNTAAGSGGTKSITTHLKMLDSPNYINNYLANVDNPSNGKIS
ncbi:MAG TPA: hypothetical protein VKR58_09000, partial [Aquella sp.]|nr:hypothetical protein [Aquella sp.]